MGSQKDKNSQVTPAKNGTGRPKPGITGTFIESRRALMEFLRRFLSRPQDIEDVLQDAYIKAVEAERSTAIRNPRAFLFRVCRNLAINENSRAFNRLSETLEDFEFSPVLCNEPALDERVDQGARFELFCRAVRSLPPQCRKVFVLGKVYGLANSEIAGYLGISVSTVEKHLVKGLVQCKGYMDRQGEGFLDSSSRESSQGQ